MRRGIRFDFNNMMDFNIGRRHGVSREDLKNITPLISVAHEHLSSLINNTANRITLGLEWKQLPFQKQEDIEQIQELGDNIARKYRNVIFLGIGGSYLGLKAAQDALAPAYYNEFVPLRKGRPRIYFEGNNLDPTTISTLLKNLEQKQTCAVVISKSGETTETKVALRTVSSWLRRRLGKGYARHIFAITDPISGTLRREIDRKQKKDPLSLRSLPLLRGVGGRYSELNMGLLHLAIIGVDIREVLDGAKAMCRRCLKESFYKNPAYMYAILQNSLYKKKNKSISIMMPFSETLKSTADWYAQLLAESLGKKYARKVEVSPEGLERWIQDKKHILNAGRTPVATRGTNDLHSIHQNNVEGVNNKTVTFIRVEKFKTDLTVPEENDFLSGKLYSALLKLAEEATEWSLTSQNRPNCTIIMHELNPYTWGQLLFFFEMATAFEGELLNVNAFDQPGVESYKNYMYYKLSKPGVNQAIADEIRKSAPLKKVRFII